MAKTVGAGALLGANAVNGLTQNFMNNTPNVSRNDKDISFADTLSQTTGSDPKADNNVRDIAPAKTVVNNSQPKNVKEENLNSKDVKSLTENETKDVASVTLDKAEQIYDKVKEVLDVTDDELDEAMEVLALTMTDLFDSTNLQNLVMEVTGTEDSVSLITDVELYDKVKDITGFADEMLNELSEETGIEVNELLDFITNDESFAEVITNVTENVNAETEIVAKPQTEASDIQVTEEIPDEKPEVKEDNDFKATDEQVRKLTEDTETVKTVNVDDKVEKTEDTTVNNNTTELTNTAETKSEPVKIEINGQKADNGKNNDRMSQNNEAPVMQAPQPQAATTVADNIVNSLESYTREQAQEILRQVTDSIKVNITAESQSMEMQLHPASLGTVNMQINSVNGQITAHLTVQSELVKAVLESQLVQLQETFNEQGTKVEAIEVTVANYNLDSGMNNNTDNNENEGNRSGNAAKRRNINLNTDSAFDEFTDEEKLMAEVMDMNGNSVDFSA